MWRTREDRISVAQPLNPQPECMDFEQLPAAPLAPNPNSIRVYANAAGNLAAIKSDGSNALPSGGGNPGGAIGDTQFNDGAGGFTNADGVSPGDTFNLQAGTLTMEMSTEISFGVGSAGVIVDNTGSVTLQAPVPGGQIIVGAANVFMGGTGQVVNVSGLQVFANNAAAISGGLEEGDLYRTSTGQVMVVF